MLSLCTPSPDIRPFPTAASVASTMISQKHLCHQPRDVALNHVDTNASARSPSRACISVRFRLYTAGFCP